MIGHAALREALGDEAMRIVAGDRLKADVHRLHVETNGKAGSVVVKRCDPIVARRTALLARRWLPAAGLQDLAPRLLAVVAEPAGEGTWHVYDDLPGHPLATHPPVAEDVDAAVTAVARVHTSFARHPLLPECRVAGGDRGIGWFSANVADAIDALGRLDLDRAIQDALLARLRDLQQATPALAEAFAAAGPDTLLHGDLWPSNVIVRADPLHARLIDWDEAGVGPYGFDLSTLLLRFELPDRPAILAAYRRAVYRLAGWELPPERELRLIFETTAQARLASLLVWSIAAAAGGDSGWLVERLESIVEWLDAVTPVLP